MVLQEPAPGREIAKGKPLFPRIAGTADTLRTGLQEEATVKIIEHGGMTENTKKADSRIEVSPQAEATVPQITLEEFQKIQLKTAKVLNAERVPRSEKLIRLQVDLGGEQRQVVAGIGKAYTPEELIGRTVVLVANLKPAKLMGVESQGMVLAAGDADVLEVLILQRDVPPGTKVK